MMDGHWLGLEVPGPWGLQIKFQANMMVYRNKILSQNHMGEMYSSILKIEGFLFVCLIDFFCTILAWPTGSRI